MCFEILNYLAVYVAYLSKSCFHKHFSSVNSLSHQFLSPYKRLQILYCMDLLQANEVTIRSLSFSSSIIFSSNEERIASCVLLENSYSLGKLKII